MRQTVDFIVVEAQRLELDMAARRIAHDNEGFVRRIIALSESPPQDSPMLFVDDVLLRRELAGALLREARFTNELMAMKSEVVRLLGGELGQ